MPSSSIKEKLMHFRAMVESDLGAVFAVESVAAAFPWPLSQFAGSLNENNDCVVLEIDGVVLGFAIFSRVLDETTLLNIAIYPDLQRRGYGRYLLEQGLESQISQGMAKCFLEVRVSNIYAQSLYQSLGFITVGERKKYYPAKKSREDALVMRRDLPAVALALIEMS
ncbi:MAG: ribosomal protein S18-alanine N-acetyltransferase [Pseudomonadales bacterium]